MAIKLPNFLRRGQDEDELDLESLLDPERFEFISIEEGKQLLDQQARQYLNMSGEEFARRYHSGEIEDYEDSNVIHVSMLLPFWDYPLDDQKNHSR